MGRHYRKIPISRKMADLLVATVKESLHVEIIAAIYITNEEDRFPQLGIAHLGWLCTSSRADLAPSAQLRDDSSESA